MAESTEGKLNSLVALALEGFPLPEGGNAPLNTNNDTDLILCLNTETKRIDTVSKASIISGGTIPNLQNVMNQGSTAIVSTPVSVQTFENITLTSTNGDINLVGGGYGILMAEANDGIKVTGGADFKGLYYNADYSADFVDRSLVDKKYVDDAVSGGGSTPNLATVLEEGNTAPTPVIITNGTLTSTIQSGNIQAENSNYKTSVKGGLISFTDNATEYTADIVPSDILVDGARFLLPSVTIATDHVLALMVNNTLPNDGGQIFLGLQQIINESGYVEAPDGSYVSLDPFGNTGFGSVDIDDNTIGSFGTQSGIVRFSTENNENSTQIRGVNGKIEVGIVASNFGGFLFDDDYTSTMTTDRHIPDIGKVKELISEGSGGISEVLGTVNEITVTNGDTEPQISLSTTFKGSLVYNSGDQTIAGTKTFSTRPVVGTASAGTNDTGAASTAFVQTTADAKVANDMTASTTVAPSKSAVISYMAANYDPIHTSAGYPYYDGVGGRTMVTGTSGAVVLANGTTQSIDLTVRGATLGTISPANTAISSGITIGTFANRTQGQINAIINAEKTGTAILSGNGTATSFTIPHGLGSVPSFRSAVAGNAASGNISYVTADSTNITINYAVAPASGTNNLSINWFVKA